MQIYPSDLTDEEWAILEPLIPLEKKGWEITLGRYAGRAERGSFSCCERAAPDA